MLSYIVLWGNKKSVLVNISLFKVTGHNYIQSWTVFIEENCKKKVLYELRMSLQKEVTFGPNTNVDIFHGKQYRDANNFPPPSTDQTIIAVSLCDSLNYSLFQYNFIDAKVFDFILMWLKNSGSAEHGGYFHAVEYPRKALISLFITGKCLVLFSKASCLL